MWIKHDLSGPDRARHSSDQHPKDVHSENVNHCPIFVREFVSSRTQTPEVWNLSVFAVFELLSHLPRFLVAWWEFRPRKRIFSPPPPNIPASTLRSLAPPPPPPSRETPSWDLPYKIAPTRRLGLPLPSPEQKKRKISETFFERNSRASRGRKSRFCVFFVFYGHNWEALNVHLKSLLTSTFVFRSGGFLFQRFELEWSLVATSLERFSVTSHEKGYQGPLLKE